MGQAEVVVAIFQFHGTLQVLPLFRKAQAFPRQSAIVESRRQVISFYAEGGDMASFSPGIASLPHRIGIAPGDFFADTQQTSRIISHLDGPGKEYPLIGFAARVFPARSPMHAFFHLLPKDRQHGRRNGMIAIGNQQRIPRTRPEGIVGGRHALLDLDQQPLRAFFIVFAHVRGQTQLGIALHAAPHTDVADFLGIVFLREVGVFFFTNVHNASNWASGR